MRTRPVWGECRIDEALTFPPSFAQARVWRRAPSFLDYTASRAQLPIAKMDGMRTAVPHSEGRERAILFRTSILRPCAKARKTTSDLLHTEKGGFGKSDLGTARELHRSGRY